ncbi:GNAT family N-acetyltransferase [Streptomyces sp. KR80]|uniref:GNAT family N-acetyltransferase n=1 Tax=Streptomyces sp. KR80 TaxID=3457426 RepID=UPI003FD27137
MIDVRRAAPDDAHELVRLREVMHASMSGDGTASTEWQHAARTTLRERLADSRSTLTAFVVDRPDGTGLASCVVGTIEYRLGGPGNPSGATGYVFNVATDPDMRRRGFSRACMEALLGWYRERGVVTIDLRASAEGEPLYAALGFVRTRDPAMRLTFQDV